MVERKRLALVGKQSRRSADALISRVMLRDPAGLLDLSPDVLKMSPALLFSRLRHPEPPLWELTVSVAGATAATGAYTRVPDRSAHREHCCASVSLVR